MRLKFIATDLQKLKVPIAYGTLYVLEGDKIILQHIARSGGWGKGPLPEGTYDLDWYTTPEEMDRKKNKKGFTRDGYGWAVHIGPRFKTKRSALMIHPDGGVKGSLGCIAMPFEDKEYSKQWYAALTSGIIKQGNVKLDVSFMFDGRRK